MKISFFLFISIYFSLFSVPGFYFFIPYLPEDPVILEAGAHDGGSTIGMAAIWPKAKIYAFEPSPDVYPTLVMNVASYSNVSTFPIALWDKDGFAQFNVSKPIIKGEIWNAQGSLLSPHNDYWQWPIRFEPVSVLTRTIDSWAKEHGISRIDFLWLDLQGVEFQVLNACPQILKTVKIIQAEYSLRPFYEGTVLYDDLKAFLEKNGFTQVAIDDQGGGGDVIFVRLP